MIRIDAAWLATAPLDMRAGTDTALARVGIALIVTGLCRIEGDAVLGTASVVLALVLLGRGGWLTRPVLMAVGWALGGWRKPYLVQALADAPWELPRVAGTDKADLIVMFPSAHWWSA